MLWALGRLSSGAPLAIIANSASLAISGTLLWFGAESLANLWVYIIGQTQSFEDWGGEATSFPRDLVKLCTAHD
jgi:hypothetical protein